MATGGVGGGGVRGVWQGGAGSGYRRDANWTVQALDTTIGADAGTGGGVVQGGDQAAAGRTGADGVVEVYPLDSVNTTRVGDDRIADVFGVHPLILHQLGCARLVCPDRICWQPDPKMTCGDRCPW